MIDPDYPNVVLAFMYRDFKIKISRDEWRGQDIYTAWVDYILVAQLQYLWQLLANLRLEMPNVG